MLGLAVRPRMRLDGLRIGRLEAEAAGAVDRADQHLQHVQRACGLETVGMGRDAAHGVEGDRAADEMRVRLAAHVGPLLFDADRLVEGDAADLGGQAADRVGGDAGLGGDGVGCVALVEIGFGQKLEGRDGRAAVVEREPAGERGADAGAVGRGRSAGRVPDERPALAVARE